MNSDTGNRNENTGKKKSRKIRKIRKKKPEKKGISLKLVSVLTAALLLTGVLGTIIYFLVIKESSGKASGEIEELATELIEDIKEAEKLIPGVKAYNFDLAKDYSIIKNAKLSVSYTGP